MISSDRGLEFIAREEGFVPYAYVDFAGVKTIGYGHVIRSGEHMPRREPDEEARAMMRRHRPAYEPDGSLMMVTRDEALELLRLDVRTAEDHVRRLVRVPLAQAQFDALVSWTFNLGGGALAGSTLLRLLNTGDYASVPAQMARWNKYRKNGQVLVSETLIARRAREGALFASEPPDGTV